MEPDGYMDYLKKKYGWFSQYYDEELDEVEIINPFSSFLAKYQVYDQTMELSIDESLCLDIQNVLNRAERKYGSL